MLKEGHFKYIGGQEQKKDTLFNTGLVWDQGEVLPVESQYVAAFFKHSTVWQLVDDQGKPIEDPQVLKRDYGIRVRPQLVEEDPPPTEAADAPDGGALTEAKTAGSKKKTAAKKASG